MTGLAAYLTLVVVVPALLLGHQGQDWPLAGLRRALQARRPREARCTPAGAPQTPSRLPRGLRDAPSAPQRRSRPSWATTQPIDNEEAA